MTATIFAPASGPGPAAITIVRISGPEAHAVATKLTGALPGERRAALRTLRHPDTREVLDRGLVLRFDPPGTATGEALVELHLHGGRAVVAAVCEALAVAGAQPAEAGAFTRRALENGRLDLTQAEGLADLLAAETESQRRAALRIADGGLRRRVEEWREVAIGLLAEVEAEIEFAEDDEVDVRLEDVRARAAKLACEIGVALDLPPAERLHDGLRVAIAGSPNRGKSTLFNRLVGREAAIVSPVAGTTRDLIEAPVRRGGFAFVFTDTAGLTDTDDAIERVGVARARAATLAADVILWLDPPPAPVASAIVVRSFADVDSGAGLVDDALLVSGKTGQGIDELWARLLEFAGMTVPGEDALILNARQRAHLDVAATGLSRVTTEQDALLVSDELNGVVSAFNTLTGHARLEPMLDALFTRFCIGK